MGSGRPTALPPRSPDLTPLNVFLWGLVKPRLVKLNQCFPNVSARGPLLASINNHGASRSCWRQCRVSELYFSSPDATAPGRSRPSRYRGFKFTLRHTTFGRTPLDQWSARRRNLHLTTHNTVKRKTSIPPAGFEPVIPASERSQTHALDRAATGYRLSGWQISKN